MRRLAIGILILIVVVGASLWSKLRPSTDFTPTNASVVQLPRIAAVSTPEAVEAPVPQANVAILPTPSLEPIVTTEPVDPLEFVERVKMPNAERAAELTPEIVDEAIVGEMIRMADGFVLPEGRVVESREYDNERVERLKTLDGNGDMTRVVSHGVLIAESWRSGTDQFVRMTDRESGKYRTIVWWENGRQHVVDFDSQGRLASRTEVVDGCVYRLDYDKGSLRKVESGCSSRK